MSVTVTLQTSPHFLQITKPQNTPPESPISSPLVPNSSLPPNRTRVLVRHFAAGHLSLRPTPPGPRPLELEQSQSSRKVQIQKEQSLKSLAKSLTVENPKSCGCNFPVDEDHIQTLRKGKGKSGSGIEVRVDVAWRDPKRQRFRKCCSVSSSKYLKLQSSLNLLCSFYDLKQRMQLYMSLGSCKEVFDSMIQVAKFWILVTS